MEDTRSESVTGKDPKGTAKCLQGTGSFVFIISFDPHGDPLRIPIGKARQVRQRGVK